MCFQFVNMKAAEIRKTVQKTLKKCSHKWSTAFHSNANQNYIHEDIKSRMNSGNAYYLSGWNLWYYSLLSKNIKTEIHRTIILPVVLYIYENWSLTLREEHRLKVLENRVLRKIMEPKRDEVAGEWRRLHK